ncbi:MAG TPA: EAL domain-containing protein [Actinomycetota bacterium]|nr:EAL domain-containing protein [Actinomycetota bacterium]
MRSRAVMRLQTESELRQAIGAGAFEAHYQPIVRLADGHPVAMEALLRWKHPDRGLLPPADFIPVAEETGLIVPLGAWVMQEACRQGSRWLGAPPAAPLAVSVNVSPRQIAQPAFADEVRAALASADLQPTSLWLEITESVLVDATSITLRVLDRLRGLGVRLAIDDFGTGYSSLGYLRRFNVDMLKIDRSFVSVLGRDAEDSAIVAAIISLARALGLSVVAEGVETPEQAEHLRALGCDLAQGYHFAHPQPADAWSSSVLAANGRRFPERPRPWRLQAPGT